VATDAIARIARTFFTVKPPDEVEQCFFASYFKTLLTSCGLAHTHSNRLAVVASSGNVSGTNFYVVE
jgi:hypothetical protein